MPDFHRICCPTDFSEASRPALEEAAQVARHYGASLTVLHVAEPLTVGPEVAFAPPPGWAEEEGLRRLEAWKIEAERLTGTAVSSSIVTGPPAASIVDFVKDTGADLVVLGSHGRHGLGRLVLGSVAEQVVRTAPCDVLVVRRPEPPRAEPGPDAPSGMPA